MSNIYESMDLGASLKNFRKKAGYNNQHHAARAIGTDQSYISQVERNEKHPSPQFLERMAQCYKVPLGIIFYFAMDESDVKPGKENDYKILKPLADKFIEELFIDNKE